MILRSVFPTDLQFLYDLMTEPSIRAVSHNKQLFTFEEHSNYWWRKINDPYFEARIIEEDAKPIGLIRRNNGTISIAILPQWQNKGIGTEVLKAFCKIGDKAEIFPANMKSFSVFEKAGFEVKFATMEKNA